MVLKILMPWFVKKPISALGCLGSFGREKLDGCHLVEPPKSMKSMKPKERKPHCWQSRWCPFGDGFLWPFGKGCWWPPTRESKGHIESPGCWCLVVWNVYASWMGLVEKYARGRHGISNFLGRKVFLEPKVGPHEREAGSIIDHCRFL